MKINLKVILYGTEHCPMCHGLETKLKTNNITYEKITDAKIMEQKGFVSVPMLEIDNKIMNSVEAIKFVNNYNKEKNNGL